MSSRIRTTKQLARRINKEYYQKLALIPRWRRLLSLILTGVALIWVAWYAFARDGSIYSAGSLTKAHASFGGQCGSCHNQGTGIARTVADTRCLACHDGPVHSVRQVSTPACAECHVEHQGREALMVSSGKMCTSCHSNLHTRGGAPNVAAAIRSFSDGHPEFHSLKDPGEIKFNHRVHLKKDLRGLAGLVQLQCGDCHRPAGIGAPADPAGSVSSPRPSRAYMAPITYAGQCASCHPLEFDPRMTEVAPHKDPQAVHEFLVAKFSVYIQAHPELLPEAASAQRIVRRSPDPLAGSAREWVLLRVADSERLLWTKTCVQCHRLTPGAGEGALPRVAPANLNARWLKQANFNHFAHAAVECERCHSAAAGSERASDVLIPGIAVCRECHTTSGRGAASAGTQCLECHQYHDWTKEKDVRHSKVGL